MVLVEAWGERQPDGVSSLGRGVNPGCANQTSRVERQAHGARDDQLAPALEFSALETCCRAKDWVAQASFWGGCKGEGRFH